MSDCTLEEFALHLDRLKNSPGKIQSTEKSVQSTEPGTRKFPGMIQSTESSVQSTEPGNRKFPELGKFPGTGSVD